MEHILWVPPYCGVLHRSLSGVAGRGDYQMSTTVFRLWSVQCSTVKLDHNPEEVHVSTHTLLASLLGCL